MRILVLSKRQYTNRDLLDDKFGRLWEIPLALARRGHQLRGLCLSYAPRREGEYVDIDDRSSAFVNWQSLNAGKSKVVGLLRFAKAAADLTKSFQPDVIWACSDTIYGVLGVRLARKFSTRCVFDLYDNFESFASYRIPGVARAYRRALRSAAALSCVSTPLKDMIVSRYGVENPIALLTNAVDKQVFKPRDRQACRLELGLPAEARLIGTAGALDASRGIDALFRGFERLAASDDSVHLVVAGPRGTDIRLPAGARVHDLGILSPDRVPIMLNALDLAVVCNVDSDFGRYNFPQKAFEILACGTPLIAARVGSLRSLLAEYPGLLFDPGDGEDLARTAALQLDNPVRPEFPVPSWDEAAAGFDAFLEALSDA